MFLSLFFLAHINTRAVSVHFQGRLFKILCCFHTDDRVVQSVQENTTQGQFGWYETTCRVHITFHYLTITFSLEPFKIIYLYYLQKHKFISIQASFQYSNFFSFHILLNQCCVSFLVELYACKVERATDSAYYPIVIGRVETNNCNSAKTAPTLCMNSTRKLLSSQRERENNNFLMTLLRLVTSYVARTYNVLE